MTETRIRWQPTKYGGFTGHVGTLETWAFQIHQPVFAGQGWVLTATFPGALDDVRPGTPEKLKAEAERWLAGFVASLGAVFPDALDCSAVTRFEVINHTTGSKRLVSYSPDSVRSVVARNVKVDLAFQDDGQTVKVFLADPRPAATAADTEE